MEIRTFADLIDWTRQLHGHLASCLAHCATENSEERARLLLDYLAEHERKLEQLVQLYEDQADPKVMHTFVYDYISHRPIETHRTCEGTYANLGFDEICKEVFDLHEQVIELYKDLEGKLEIREANELLRSLSDMEEHEAMRLVRQTGRMQDL